MATLGEILADKIQDLDEQIKVLAFRTIKDQAPRLGNRPKNPYATGALYSRLNPNMVTITADTNGAWTIQISLARLPRQAVFTNFGTNNHNETALIEREGPFGLPFMGYSRGRFGVRAQNWTSLARVDKQIRSLYEQQIRMSLDTYITNTIENL